MVRESGRWPERTRRWTWLGRRAQAYTVTAPAWARAARRRTKSARSRSSRKKTRPSIPRAMTWWRTPGASRRGPRGMAGGYAQDCMLSSNIRDNRATSPIVVPYPQHCER